VNALGASSRVLEQDTNVLNGGDEKVLNLLLGQTSPPGAFKVVVVGGVGEAAFH
jgi:hypothetical protein